MSTLNDPDAAALELSPLRRLLVLITVVVASAAYNAATFTATAILPQMQGSMSASQDEISWTVTFNILATAVVTPMSGWLVARFGRARLQTFSLAGFTLATLMCGSAQSLQSLVFWRVAQGACGAPLLPLGQTILLDIFPRRQHALVISIFGVANTVGPIMGPTFAGFLAEHYSWRWGYWMIVPFGVLAGLSAHLVFPREAARHRVNLDWIGFLALSTAIAATQLALSRGQQNDWFESTEIVIEVCIAVLALYVFIVHSLTAKSPYISLRLLLDRNYLIGVFLVCIFGMCNFTPMVLLPPMLQNQLGYPDSLVGYVVSSRGLGVMSGFFAAAFIGRLDARVGMVLGFSLQIVSGTWLTSIDFNVSLATLCVNAWLQGLAVGLIWTPMATTAFWTLAPELRAEGVAVFHLMRSIGTSFFVAISVAEVMRTTGANFSRMTEFVSPYNELLRMPGVIGGWHSDTVPGLAALSREITRQATMLGYMNAFGMYTVVSVVAVPLVLMVSRARRPSVEAS
ncbi:MAG: DHA2 family efflux MFS transporter permease subunit [Gammaproteobacteria bacterium]|nr:DHA2 family efflux MFS transporter permease subunit [Gammaproteobacteria bacterium]